MTAAPHKTALLRWFQHFAGCRFASSFTFPASDRIRLWSEDLVIPTADAVEEFDSFLEGCAGESCAGVLVFPRVASEKQLESLLVGFDEFRRWRVEESAEPTKGRVFSVAWHTAEGRCLT